MSDAGRVVRSGAVSQAERVAESESRALEECWAEAFWFRAIPWATVSGAAVLMAARRGKIRPGSARFGPWPRVLGAAFAGFWAGKISYLMGRGCQDKFLMLAPDSDISRSIRENRGLDPDPGAVAAFNGAGDGDENDGDDFPLDDPPPPTADVADEMAPGQEGDMDEIEELVKATNASHEHKGGRHGSGSVQVTVEKDKRDEIHIKTDDEEIVINLSNREQRILEDCRKVSVYYFSLPLSLGLGGLAYFSQARGYLKESKRFSRQLLRRAPKTVVLSGLGYVTGQVLYMFSSDCAERFLKQAPNGQMAKAIRMMREGQSPGEAFNKGQHSPYVGRGGGGRGRPSWDEDEDDAPGWNQSRYGGGGDPFGDGDGGGGGRYNSSTGRAMSVDPGRVGRYVMPPYPRRLVDMDVATPEDLIKDSLDEDGGGRGRNRRRRR